MNFKKQRLLYLFSITLSVLILSFAFPGLFDLMTRVTFAASGDLYTEDFEGYAVGTDPDYWFDTDARNRHPIAVLFAAQVQHLTSHGNSITTTMPTSGLW